MKLNRYGAMFVGALVASGTIAALAVLGLVGMWVGCTP
jgi:hypothetical protein